MRREGDRYSIIGAMRLCEFHPSFALAVAERPGEPGYWLQVMAPDGERIDSFTLLSDEDADAVTRLIARPVAIGDEYVHAFVERNGGVLIGTARELHLEFKLALNHPSTSTPVKLSLSEHLGDRDKGRELRERVADDLADVFGANVGETYINSVARCQLWLILEREAASADALLRIRKARPRLSAKVTGDAVSLDLSAIDPGDLRIGFDAVQAAMQQEFKRVETASATPLADLSRLPGSDSPNIVTILAALERSSRQEERIAILLRALILYPDAARQAIERYRDPAKMARAAVELLRLSFTHFPTNEEGREVWISNLVPRLLQDAYPKRRGAMLYYLAAHLADFRLVADKISAAVARTASHEVNAMRERIEDALIKGAQAGRPPS